MFRKYLTIFRVFFLLGINQLTLFSKRYFLDINLLRHFRGHFDG